MKRPRAEIERDLVRARAREDELVAEHERNLTDVRARIAEFEAELALLVFDPTPGLVVVGSPRSLTPVRTITTACELSELATGFKCPTNCRHQRALLSAEPVRVLRLVPRAGYKLAAEDPEALVVKAEDEC